MEIARQMASHGGSLRVEECSGKFDSSPRVLSVLSSLLQKMVHENDLQHGVGDEEDSSPQRTYRQAAQRLTVFHGQRAPAISVEQYVERIFKYANCSPSCFVVAYAYLDRFIHHQPDIPITSLNVHRLLITSVMVAAKFLDDSYYNNAYYGKVGGVATHEMNRMELEFLFRLGFRLQVTLEVFDSYCSHLERELAAGYLHVVPRVLVCAAAATPDQEPTIVIIKAPTTSSYPLAVSAAHTNILESVS